jgi:hypothetical protein
MTPASLALAFNTFYRQNVGFPKPDVLSDENSMIGMDPYQAGMGQGEILFCQISPLHRITLDSETKVAANIPVNAISFAWAYPMVRDAQMPLPRGQAEAAFIEFGGYIYFDDQQNVVGTNSIRPAPLGTLGLMFGRSQPLPADVADIMTKQGRFQEITLQALAEKGATHFAWIRPQEFPGSVASPNGCFAYKFADGNLRYFPVVSKPVFTRDLLQEELESSEAWVVIRDPLVPSVEAVIILDKTKTLEDNLLDNSHDFQVGSFASIMASRENGSKSISYEEWQCSSEPGTIASPWIFQPHLQPKS